MQLARTRSLFFLAFIACALIVGATAYLAQVVGAAPCPLCFMQRTCLLGCAAVFLIAAAHAPHPRGWQVYASILLLFGLTGAAVAARQVWLQQAPPEDIVSCLANLQHLIETQPYVKVIAMTLAGSAGCSQITWTLFGISLPEWSLLAFAGVTLFALYYLFIEFRRFGSMDLGVDD